MPEHTSRSSATSPETTETAPQGNAAAEPHVNGTAGGKAADAQPRQQQSPPQADGSAPQPGAAHDDRSGLDRAEEIVDHLAERASALTASGGRKVLWFMSRAREVAEDFWADVQDFRRGKKP